MGFSPRQVDAMSVWEFQAAVDGYLRANGAESNGGLTDADEEELWQMIQSEGAYVH